MARNPFLERWREIFSQKKRLPALLAPDGGVLRTFDQIEQHSESWAARLIGLAPRPVVSLVAGNAAEWPEVLLGVWKAGGAVLVAGDSLGGTELESVEKLAGCNARILESGEACTLLRVDGGVDLSGLPDLFKVTSGTSSTRRLVSFRADQFLADVDNVRVSMGIRDSDRNLGLIPFSHSYGLTNLVGLLLGAGVAAVIGVDVLPRAVASAAQTCGATVLPGVPTLFRAMSVLEALPQSLRLLISAGALLPALDARAFHNKFGRKIHSFYGASECGGICFDASDDPAVPEGFVGPPLCGVSLGEDATGEGLFIQVQGPAVGSAYRPARTGDALDEQGFRPRDILQRSNGGYRLVGRESDFINVAGRKVNPNEIEAVFRKHPGVFDVAVFSGADDSGRGELVAVCLVAEADKVQLRAYCASVLPPWQIPRAWFFVEKLPMNERGKSSRKALREAFFPNPA